MISKPGVVHVFENWPANRNTISLSRDWCFWLAHHPALCWCARTLTQTHMHTSAHISGMVLVVKARLACAIALTTPPHTHIQINERRPTEPFARRYLPACQRVAVAHVQFCILCYLPGDRRQSHGFSTTNMCTLSQYFEAHKNSYSNKRSMIHNRNVYILQMRVVNHSNEYANLPDKNI